MISDNETITLSKKIQGMIKPYREVAMGYHSVDILTNCGQWLKDYNVSNVHTLHLKDGDSFTLEDIDCVTVNEPESKFK